MPLAAHRAPSSATATHVTRPCLSTSSVSTTRSRVAFLNVENTGSGPARASNACVSPSSVPAIVTFPSPVDTTLVTPALHSPTTTPAPPRLAPTSHARSVQSSPPYTSLAPSPRLVMHVTKSLCQGASPSASIESAAVIESAWETPGSETRQSSSFFPRPAAAHHSPRGSTAPHRDQSRSLAVTGAGAGSPTCLAGRHMDTADEF
mmetsp:Transcript_415/g.1529  ORF Transcript_415/g.1529 Transcript_415/m.1529 type:complete len:205 (+) Transcript_415:1722-2336(+)